MTGTGGCGMSTWQPWIFTPLRRCRPARARLLERIHLLDAGGQVHVGMAVFRLAYRAVGLGWLVAPTGWPLLRPLFDRLYGCFARHRIGLGRRFGRPCDSGSCRLR